jgi:hypothetical protein
LISAVNRRRRASGSIWGSGTFHSPCHPDLFAGRGIPQRSRTDLTGDHPARIQTHPQPQRHAVAARHLCRKPVRLLLNGQRGQTPPEGMILQCDRGAEQRHHPVAGVLHGAAVTLHDRGRPLDELGHDFAEPLDIHGGSDVH